MLVVKNPPANAGDISDMGSNPGLGRCPGIENGNPLQYSCLENSMDKRTLPGYSSWAHKLNFGTSLVGRFDFVNRIHSGFNLGIH